MITIVGDNPGQRITLAPNSRFNEPFRYDRSNSARRKDLSHQAESPKVDLVTAPVAHPTAGQTGQ